MVIYIILHADSLSCLSSFFINYNTLAYWTDIWSSDILLMEGGSNLGGGSSTSGNQPGGSEPGGNRPDGSGPHLPNDDSPEVRKRKRLANYLQILYDREIEDRRHLDPRMINRNVTITDLNVTKISTRRNLTLPSVTPIDRELVEYSRNFPDAFKTGAPGSTLVSKVIDHLNNNNS